MAFAASSRCRHPDVRNFGEIRCCLSCGSRPLIGTFRTKLTLEIDEPHTPKGGLVSNQTMQTVDF